MGLKKKHPRNDLLYWHGSNGFEAIRVGNWKLFPKRLRANLKGNGPALFELSKDIEEKNDLSQLHPERVKSMQNLANQRLADIRIKFIPLGESKTD